MEKNEEIKEIENFEKPEKSKFSKKDFDAISFGNEGYSKSSIENQKDIISSKTVKELEEESEHDNLKKIEAALFLAARFLSLKDLVLLTDINPLMVKELIEKLIEKYDNDNSAIEVINKENMWKMDVKKEYFDMINKLATGSSEFTKAEQETLAVIAYKQPVKQSVIIKIRGNKAYEHIKKFLSNGLIIGKKLGHTQELKLSDEFHDYFHIQQGKILDDPDKSILNEDLSDLQDNKLQSNTGESEHLPNKEIKEHSEE